MSSPISTRIDTTVVTGPAAVFFNSAVVYVADKIMVQTKYETFAIPTSHLGPMGRRVKQILTDITFKPAGQCSAAAFAALCPHTSAQPGSSAMPATAQTVTIWPLNGKEQIVYENGYVAKMPDLDLSATKPLFGGSCTLRCIGKDNTAWSAADKQLVLTATVAFADTSFSLADVKTVPYSVVLGSLGAPWNGLRTRQGVKVSFNVPLDEETYNTDAEGIIDVLYKEGASVQARFAPVGVIVADLHGIMRLQGSGAGRGMEVGDLACDLVVDAGSGLPKATLKNVQLVTAPGEYRAGDLRVPELEFVSTRQAATGGASLQALFALVMNS